jgi:hypothetical protein
MKKATKVKNQTVKNGEGKQNLKSIENEIQLEEIIKYKFKGRETAAYLLRKGSGLNTSWKFIFGFRVAGIHTTLPDDILESAFESIAEGLKDIPQGEELTIHFSSFNSDEMRQAELSQLVQDAPMPISFLLLGEQKRVEELKDQGLRKPMELKMYVSYTVDPITANASDWVESLLLRLDQVWNNIAGTAQDVERFHFEEMVERAFVDGFKIWEELLKTKMELDILPIQADELWEGLYRRFNRGVVPQIPHSLSYTDDGLVDEGDTQYHITTHLFPGSDSVPYPDRSFVYVKENYVGTLCFNDKPAGWMDKEAQLKYLWKLFSREGVRDTECYCQITKAPKRLVQEDIQRVTRQATASVKTSLKNAGIDVGANLRQRHAVDAQESLLEGAVPIYAAVVFLVHRPKIELLDNACRYLENCFNRPAWVDREKEYAWKIWLQTLPTTWGRLLQAPFDRRLLYLNSEVPGFMNLVHPNEIDRTGVELISEEGQIPIHLDYFKIHRNILLLGTTRSGKSVFVAYLLLHALARGIPVIIMDFPPTDEASTFKDFTHFVNGAYFDLGTEKNNILQPPDLRHLSKEKQEDRFSDFTNGIATILLIMIFGTSSGGLSTDEKMIKQAILALLVPVINKFYENEDIWRRFMEARAAGIGTRAWEEVPTLHHFKEFFIAYIQENLSQSEKEDSTNQKAINQIIRQLAFWLESRVGKSLSSPSSFNNDSQLLVYALRGLSDGEDAAVLAMSAYLAALRRSLESDSILFIDEFSIMLEFEEIGNMIAKLVANTAKAGIRVFLAAQDPDTLGAFKGGAKILQNISTKIIMRIAPEARDSFERVLRIPGKVIAKNSTRAFYPNKGGLYSKMLMVDRGQQTVVRFYPSKVLLAVVANNPPESRARRVYLDTYQNPYEAILKFSESLVESIQQDKPIEMPEGLVENTENNSQEILMIA